MGRACNQAPAASGGSGMTAAGVRAQSFSSPRALRSQPAATTAVTCASHGAFDTNVGFVDNLDGDVDSGGSTTASAPLGDRDDDHTSTTPAPDNARSDDDGSGPTSNATPTVTQEAVVGRGRRRAITSTDRSVTITLINPIWRSRCSTGARTSLATGAVLAGRRRLRRRRPIATTSARSGEQTGTLCTVTHHPADAGDGRPRERLRRR